MPSLTVPPSFVDNIDVATSSTMPSTLALEQVVQPTAPPATPEEQSIAPPASPQDQPVVFTVRLISLWKSHAILTKINIEVNYMSYLDIQMLHGGINERLGS